MVLTGVCLTLNAASMDDLQAQKHQTQSTETKGKDLLLSIGFAFGL
jgi:hypothetical protein